MSLQNVLKSVEDTKEGNLLNEYLKRYRLLEKNNLWKIQHRTFWGHGWWQRFPYIYSSGNLDYIDYSQKFESKHTACHYIKKVIIKKIKKQAGWTVSDITINDIS